MANEFTININIKSADSPATEKTRFQETTDPNKSTAAGESGNGEKDKTKEMVKGLNAKVAYRFVMGNANRIISSRISTIGMRYGDEALQNRINNIYTNVSSAVNTAGGMVMTAMSGNYIAMGIQAINLALSSTMDILNRVQSFRIGEAEEERNITRQAERLGIVASKGGR